MGGMHELVAAGNLRQMEQAILRDPQSVNEPNQSGLPPLYTAALHHNQPAIDFLLDHGADVDICACAYLGKAASAESLLQANAALVESRTPNGMTPLHYAARAGHCDVAAMLLKFHADANACDNNGTTPLDEAGHAWPLETRACRSNHRLACGGGGRAERPAAAATGP